MLLKKLIIENFACFYGNHVFDLSEGLTLFNASNGCGKSTIVRALGWLFGNKIEDRRIVSLKKYTELSAGESMQVKVKLYFHHHRDIVYERNLTFIKEDNGGNSYDDFRVFNLVDGREIEVPAGSVLEPFTLDYMQILTSGKLDIDNIVNHYKLPAESIRFIDMFSKRYNINKNYSILLGLRDYCENIIGECYPVILDSPCYHLSNSECQDLFDLTNKTNKQYIVATSYFLNEIKKVDKEKIQVLNGYDYYLEKSSSPDDISQGVCIVSERI